MENKVPKWKMSLNYGLIVGGILIIFNLVIYLFDALSRESYLNLFNYAILLGGIIWGAKTYRDIYNEGYSTYSEAFGSGFLVGLFSTILLSIFWYILYKLDPALIENIILQTEEQMYESSELSDSEIEQAISMTRRFTTPFIIAITSLIWTTIINLVLSLIVAIFIKREKPFGNTVA